MKKTAIALSVTKRSFEACLFEKDFIQVLCHLREDGDPINDSILGQLNCEVLIRFPPPRE